jgi:hypothetical protein
LANQPTQPKNKIQLPSKAVEEKQTATKIENQTTLVQHPAGMADISASKARQSALGADRPGPARGPSALHQEASGQPAPGADRPAPARGPSAVHQEASNDTPTSMEEDGLLGEDLVDYEASPERPGMDVNVITFSADCTIVGDDEPVVA